MPPTGSCLLVRSNDPPWLHLPWSREHDGYATQIAEDNKHEDEALKLPAGLADEKMLK